MNQIDFQILPEAQTILVDGLPISTGYAIGYSDLVASAIGAGEYFPLTCGCGVPGCAGLDKPIVVRHSAGSVTWHVVEPGPERTFVFARSAYVAAIRAAMEKVVRLNPTLPEDQKLGPYGTSQEGFEDLLRRLQ